MSFCDLIALFFFFKHLKGSIVWRYQFIHSPTEGHLGCLQVLTITDIAAVSIHVQVFVGINFQLLWVNVKESCSFTLHLLSFVCI